MNDEFDRDEFIDWMLEQDGPIEDARLREEFPNFPLTNLAGVTAPIVDGEFAYYKHDLRRAANGHRAID